MEFLRASPIGCLCRDCTKSIDTMVEMAQREGLSKTTRHFRRDVQYPRRNS
jgi:hypothetical protein